MTSEGSSSSTPDPGQTETAPVAVGAHRAVPRIRTKPKRKANAAATAAAASRAAIAVPADGPPPPAPIARHVAMRAAFVENQAAPADGFTGLGRVVKPHGIRGEVRVFAFQPGAPNMQQGRTIHVGGVRRKIVRARLDRDAWIMQLQGVANRESAEALRGMLLEAPDGEVQREDADSYFVHELVGLRVITDEGEELGELAEVLSMGAADVYVVRGPRGEVLLPAIAQVVSRIDLPVGVMTITPLPGLLDKPK